MKSLRCAAGLAVVASALLVPQSASAANCLVSDPYNHTDDTPIAGTYTTATGAADTATTLDTRAWTTSLFEGWLLTLRKLGIVLIVK